MCVCAFFFVISSARLRCVFDYMDSVASEQKPHLQSYSIYYSSKYLCNININISSYRWFIITSIWCVALFQFQYWYDHKRVKVVIFSFAFVSTVFQIAVFLFFLVWFRCEFSFLRCVALNDSIQDQDLFQFQFQLLLRRLSICIWSLNIRFWCYQI